MDKCCKCDNLSAYGRHYIKNTDIVSQLFCDKCYFSNRGSDVKNTTDRGSSPEDNQVPVIPGLLEVDSFDSDAREA